MDKKSRELMNQLLALKRKAQALAREQKKMGEEIDSVLEHHKRWLDDKETEPEGTK